MTRTKHSRPQKWWEIKSPQAYKSSAGRPSKYSSAEELWEACQGYFEWIENNPLYEAKHVHNNGLTWIDEVPKQRPMTIIGLCRYLGLSQVRYWQMRNEDTEMGQVIRTVDDIIKEQKFTGAVVGFFNPSLISRDLGLKEQHELSGPNGGPIQHSKQIDLSNLTEDELRIILKAKPEALD